MADSKGGKPIKRASPKFKINPFWLEEMCAAARLFRYLSSNLKNHRKSAVKNLFFGAAADFPLTITSPLNLPKDPYIQMRKFADWFYANSLMFHGLSVEGEEETRLKARCGHVLLRSLR